MFRVHLNVSIFLRINWKQCVTPNILEEILLVDLWLGNNCGIKHEFTYYLKESCGFVSDLHFSFKYFSKYSPATKFYQKEPGLFLVSTTGLNGLRYASPMANSSIYSCCETLLGKLNLLTLKTPWLSDTNPNNFTKTALSKKYFIESCFNCCKKYVSYILFSEIVFSYEIFSKLSDCVCGLSLKVLNMYTTLVTTSMAVCGCRPTDISGPILSLLPLTSGFILYLEF